MIGMRAVLLSFYLLLLSCGGNSEVKHGLDCAKINGVGSLFGNVAPRMIIFGEMHGTQEAPKFIGDVICHSLQRGGKTILAIEHSRDMVVDYSRFMTTSPKSNYTLMGTPQWSGGRDYGVTSIAMLQLVEQMYDYGTLGYDIKIAPFDLTRFEISKFKYFPGGFGANREEFMAQHLMDLMKENPDTTIIVLTGNLHSNQGVRTKGEIHYQYMANYLPKDKIVSLFPNNQAGTIWANIGGKSGVHELGQSVSEVFLVDGQPSEERRIHMFDELKRGHNGLYYLVTQTASPPALSQENRE